MWKILIFVIVVVLICVIAVVALNNGAQKTTNTNGVIQPASIETTNRAAFAIFTNGTYRIFSDSKYHKLSTDVYIEEENPNILIVKKKGITWSDFFNTLPMKLSKDCLVTGTGQKFCNKEGGKLNFYINGENDYLALDKEIKNGDTLLVSFGINQNNLKEELSQIPDPK